MTFPEPFFRWRPHPWHGLDIGPNPPEIVHAYIEITPYDLVKYEIDKITGYMRVDRPQRSSSQPPTLYGFIPRTYCGARVCAFSSSANRADYDPLDICVLSERPINRSEVILKARVIGGIQVIDHGEADDKIVAVLANDNFWGSAQQISDVPTILIERLHHYFSTYKMIPGEESQTFIEKEYDRDHALKVVTAAMADYTDEFGQ